MPTPGNHPSFFVSPDERVTKQVQDTFERIASLATSKPTMARLSDGPNINVRRVAGKVIPINELDPHLVAYGAGVVGQPNEDIALVNKIIAGSAFQASVSLNTSFLSMMRTIAPLPIKAAAHVSRYSYTDMMSREGANPLYKVDPKSKAFGLMKTSFAYQYLVVKGALRTAVEKAVAATQLTDATPVLVIPILDSAGAFTSQVDTLSIIIDEHILNTTNTTTDGEAMAVFKDGYNQIFVYDAKNDAHPIIVHFTRFAAERTARVSSRKSSRNCKYEYVTSNCNPLFGTGMIRRSIEVGDNLYNYPVFGESDPGKFDRSCFLAQSFLSNYYYTGTILSSGVGPYFEGKKVELTTLDVTAFSVLHERLFEFGIYDTSYDSTVASYGFDADLFYNRMNSVAQLLKDSKINEQQADEYIAGICGLTTAKTVGKAKTATNEFKDAPVLGEFEFWKGYIFHGGLFYKLSNNEGGWMLLRALERDVTNIAAVSDLNPSLNARQIKGYGEAIRSHRVSTAKVMTQCAEIREEIKNVLLEYACYNWEVVTGAIRLSTVNKGDALPTVRLM